jgi:serine phosphatase RsbU (regulator of sigma subunit)
VWYYRKVKADMLKFSDFFHLPKIDDLIDQISTSPPGVIVVAGLKQRSIFEQTLTNDPHPSGCRMFFGILLDEIMTANPDFKAVVLVTEKSAVRIPRQLRRRTEICTLKSPDLYNEHISQAINNQINLLVIECLLQENISSAFSAAKHGLQVLTQLDTVLHGAWVVKHLVDLGMDYQNLSLLTWILSVQRLATLCPKCKQESFPDTNIIKKINNFYQFPKYGDIEKFQLNTPSYQHTNLLTSKGVASNDDRFSSDLGKEEIKAKEYEEISNTELGVFYRSTGCDDCQYTGRKGDIAVLDILKADTTSKEILNQPSLIPMEWYILHLASLGYLSLEDFFFSTEEQLRRTFNLLTTTERTFYETKFTLERKLLELKSANQVLQQRTRALISLQGLGQTLIQSTDLESLSREICLRTCDLLGADRIILYYQRTPDDVEILATKGWEIDTSKRILLEDLFYGVEIDHKPIHFDQNPPGVKFPSGSSKVDTRGLLIPLIAQSEQIGTLIIHSEYKTRFQPKEIALLVTIANQTALAIQRASLFEQLHLKITELESARVELLQKERLEHEMELARQVQLSVLPHSFPKIHGYRFAAKYAPAREVGGDFYDVIMLDKDHIGLAIADVSDKGLAAALYMALTRSLLLAEAQRDQSPARVLVNINRLLKELGNPDLFVTIFYAVLDLKNRNMVYSRAGHDRPLILRKEGIEELPGEGTALAIFDTAEFSNPEGICQLKRGDRLVLYTDGLCDVLGSDGDLYDRSRLKSLIASNYNLHINDLCDRVFDDIAQYRGEAEQYDDMAMLVVEVI